ncbi:MAG: hypothetical protein ACMUIP_12005 [bacterium]
MALAFVLTCHYSFALNQSDTSSSSKSAQAEFELYMARGKLSFADGYFDSAIKNFKKALDLNSDSIDARDRYAQSVLYKKLGVLMESTSSG